MYISNEALEEMRKKGEELSKQMHKQTQGKKFKSQSGDKILCIHCNNDTFHRGEALLNTRGLTFLDLDWMNNSATTLMCNSCGLILWFGKDVQQLQE